MDELTDGKRSTDRSTTDGTVDITLLAEITHDAVRISWPLATDSLRIQTGRGSHRRRRVGGPFSTEMQGSGPELYIYIYLCWFGHGFLFDCRCPRGPVPAGLLLACSGHPSLTATRCTNLDHWN